MAMFTNESRQFKFQILTEICRESFEGTLDEAKVQAEARNMVSLGGPRYRCCVYKEREILRQRVRLSLGHMANDAAEYKPKQIVQVIDAACDGCTIQKIRVTDNCRKCMAKACMAACHFGAISMGSERSQIDYQKCKQCGACARACPYNAIVVTERPCYAHCPVQAISWDSNNLAVIDDAKCINCGQCELHCPFGAIEDMSWVVPVIQLLRMGVPCYAIVAPSIQGQFGKATLPQIQEAIRRLGFTDCLEVANGADAIAYYEAQELKKHMAEGKPLTTSCCSAFINMLKIHYPEQYKDNKSDLVSPMKALARKVKQDHPDAGVVFIGPCVAKKNEAMGQVTSVDYVLTFEELAAMLLAEDIDCEKVTAPADTNTASNFGRNFAMTGGVAGAVQEVLKEEGFDKPIRVVSANGGKQCKLYMDMIKAGKFQGDILEGMGCEGGCIGGPAVLTDMAMTKGRMMKENMPNKAKSVNDALAADQYYESVDLKVKEDEQ